MRQGVRVVLIVQNSISEHRKKEGWTIPEMADVEVIVSPDDSTIKDLIKQHRRAVHIFSGINSYDLCKKALFEAIIQKCKIGITSEPYEWRGLKGYARLLRAKYQKYILGNKIDFIFAIGDRGRWWFEKVGYHSRKIFDWAYFVESSQMESNLKAKEDIFNLIFVGRLNDQKGILNLVECVKDMKDTHLKVIGVGKYYELLQKENIKNVELLGQLENKEVLRHIENSDLLVLPSTKKEGWGAVANEALMVGTPVIMSDNCGASVLLDGKIRGEKFSYKDKKALYKTLEKWKMKEDSIEHRDLIRKWSKRISGNAGADYFLSVIDWAYKKKDGTKPIAPWMDKEDNHRVLIDASNVSYGGAVELLGLVLDVFQKNKTDYQAIIKPGMQFPNIPEEKLIRRKVGLPNRKRTYREILASNTFDKVLCFGNYPPPIKMKEAQVYTYLHRLFLVEKRDDQGSLKRKIYIKIVSFYLARLLKNTNYVLVQSELVKSTFLKNYRFDAGRCKVYPIYKEYPNKRNELLGREKGFVYVSAYYKHKNHINLFKAWEILKSEDIIPPLYITIGQNSSFIPQVNQYIEKGLNIINLGHVNNDECLEVMVNNEFTIFPSKKETLGLGLVESYYSGNKIIASELPYVYSVVNPSLTFDPENPNDIAQKVKKALQTDLPDSELILKNKLWDFLDVLN